MLRPRPRPAAPEAVAIRPFAEHPEAARLAALSAALAAAKNERQRLLDIDAHEAELRLSSGRARGQRAERIQEALTRLRQQAPPVRPVPPAASEFDAQHPTIARGMQLARGEAIPLEPDRAARQAQLRGELAVLDAAWRACENLWIELQAAESERVAREQMPQHNAILRSYFEAGVALAAAIEAERRHFADVLLAGYIGRPDLMLRPSMHGALRIGNLAAVDSELSTERRRFEMSGVL